MELYLITLLLYFFSRSATAVGPLTATNLVSVLYFDRLCPLTSKCQNLQFRAIFFWGSLFLSKEAKMPKVRYMQYANSVIF